MEVSPVSSRLLGDPESTSSSGLTPSIKAGSMDLKSGPKKPVSVLDPEDKESADPRGVTLLTQDRKQPLKDSGNLCPDIRPFKIHRREDKSKEKATTKTPERTFPTKIVSSPVSKIVEDSQSGDGFEIDDNLQLDDVGESKSEADTEDEATSPVITSLFRNRVTFIPESNQQLLCSDSTQNGASPLLNLPQPQERRRLDFDSFLSGGSNSGSRRGFRRCMSMVEKSSPSATAAERSPPSGQSNALLNFTSPVSRHSGTVGFKRPIAPCLLSEDIVGAAESSSCSQGPAKRRRALNDGMRSSSSPAIGEGKSSAARPLLSRSKSMLDPAAAAQIMHACNLVDDHSNLTGDTRGQLTLPTVKGSGKNHDLKNIDCHTLANVVNGKYHNKVAKIRIIDARYCYEFEGGHITGAENFGAWDEVAFLREFFPESLGAKKFKVSSKEEEKREILVFHCEFSSARGPALMRKLRSKDRELNKATYPALHYPECYLLYEGYKVFYENYPELCEPKNYVPMAHPDFSQEERKFHKKSKTWAGGGATVSRTGASSRLLKL